MNIDWNKIRASIQLNAASSFATLDSEKAARYDSVCKNKPIDRVLFRAGKFFQHGNWRESVIDHFKRFLAGATLARLFAGTEFDIPPTCDRCGNEESDCDCPELKPEKVLVDPGKQTARIAVEKRKKGKIVTVVSQLAASDNDLPGLCTQLKNHCGAGGTVQQDQVEIQGEHAQRVSEFLANVGYKIQVFNNIVKKKS